MPIPDLDLAAAKQYSLDPGSHSISWSKNGFICYATPPSQGHNLNMTFLENTDGSKWQLSAPHKLTIKPLENSTIPALLRVLWSNILTDLAVFDEHGSFYILLAGVGLLRGKNSGSDSQIQASSSTQGRNTGSSASNSLEEAEGPSYELTSYNHAEMIYRDIATPGIAAANHGRCVAFEWLGIDKPQIINKPAKAPEHGPSYAYGVQQFQSPLLAHPITTKQACVALREDGMFNLYHQGEHKVEYHKLSINLAPKEMERGLHLTHASIGFTADKKIIVVAYDAVSRKILTYSLIVEWGYLVESAVRQKTDPHYYTPREKQTAPSLKAELLCEMSTLPSVQAVSALEGTDLHYEEIRLSLIDVLSPYYAPESCLEVLVSYEVTGPEENTSYTIQRFHIREASELLSGPFAVMSDLEPPIREKLFSLSLQDKLTVPGRLKAVHTAISGSIVLLINEDSTIIPVDRTNWSIIVQDNQIGLKMETDPGYAQPFRPKSINSLLDCGFQLPRLQADSAPFLFAISPNLTGVVHVKAGANETPVFSVVKRPPRELDVKLLSLAFSHTHAHACYSNTSSDDLMALIQAEYENLADVTQKQLLVQTTIAESHSSINFHLNTFNKESVDKLLSNPPLQKLLSLQLTMSDLGHRNVSGDIAWIVLSLRSTSFGIMFSLSSIYRQMSKKKAIDDNMEDSINRAECIILLVGSVKWFIDLLIYLNQELLQLSYAKTNPEQSIITVENSVVLPLLLSKVPRLFLMYAITSIGKTHEILKKLHKDLSESNKLFTPMKEALERFFNTSNHLPLKLNIFEVFLRECDDYITKELSSKWADRAKLLQLEQQLFCSGEVPAELLPVAYTIIDRFSANNHRDPRLSALYFYDSRWLNVGAAHREYYDKHAEQNAGQSEPTKVRLQYSASEATDALRKVLISCKSPIQSGGTTPMGRYFNSTYKLKKCVRCRSVSLVSDPLVFDSARAIGLWTMVFQRNCICGSAWVNCGSDDSPK